MKKVLLAFTLFMIFGLYACGQRKDGNFNTPIYVVKIIYADGTEQTTALNGTVIADWNTIKNKPALFSGDYNDLKNLPQQISLQDAIRQLGYLPIPGQLTTALPSFIPPVGSGGIIWDITAQCYKLWNPATSSWSKIVITNN